MWVSSTIRSTPGSVNLCGEHRGSRRRETWGQQAYYGAASRPPGVSSALMAERLAISPTWKTVSDAVLAVAAELSVDEVLQRLVHSARELAGARFAALGLPDGEGG